MIYNCPRPLRKTYDVHCKILSNASSRGSNWWSVTHDISLPCCLGHRGELMANSIPSAWVSGASWDWIDVHHISHFCFLNCLSTCTESRQSRHIAWLFFSTPYVCEILLVISRFLNIKQTVQSVIWINVQIITFIQLFLAGVQVSEEEQAFLPQSPSLLSFQKGSWEQPLGQPMPQPVWFVFNALGTTLWKRSATWVASPLEEKGCSSGFQTSKISMSLCLYDQLWVRLWSWSSESYKF